MKIDLQKPFAANSAVAEGDVRMMKIALNRLGYYQPYKKIGITEVPDAGVFNALKSFQRDQELMPTGAAKPGDDTVKALNKEFDNKKIGKYIWRTVEDNKVRSSHAALNGTVCDLADSPDPGEELNCRCWAEPVFVSESSPKTVDEIDDPPIRPVYPELLLTPLFRAGRLYNLWRLWLVKRDTDWVLGKHKSDTKWGNQLRQRNWTPDEITDTIKHGRQYPAPNNINKANPAMRYEYKGRYIVRDEVTKEILQLGKPDFKRLLPPGE